jgi:hypothetical protein
MRTVALLAMFAALAGCTLLDRIAPSRPGQAPAPVVEAQAAERDLAQYLARLRGLSENAVASEVARQRSLAARDSGDLARLRLALALSLSSPADDGEVLGLVEPLARSPSADSLVKGMAGFLQAMAVERRRLKESAAAAGTRLREERRALEAQKQRADALSERATQLQQKLDGLTELEKTLSDRPASNR